MGKKLVIDCDPGHDDMIAIMLAIANTELELLGITTVAGNQTGEKTFKNALRILTLLEKEKIPLARGCDKPLIRDLVTALRFMEFLDLMELIYQSQGWSH